MTSQHIHPEMAKIETKLNSNTTFIAPGGEYQIELSKSSGIDIAPQESGDTVDHNDGKH